MLGNLRHVELRPTLAFEQVPLSESGPLTFDVPGHTAASIVGSEASGVGLLGRYALALEAPPAGRVLVLGEDPAHLPRRALLAFRRRVGYLPAGDGLLQNLSLYDNVALPLRFGTALAEREIAGRIAVALTMVGVAAAAPLRPAQANEEQRRRAALARALAFDPELVILEQPFDGLTARTAAELLELARGGETAAGARRTVFMIGQDLPAMLRPRVEVRYRLIQGRLERES